MQPIFLQWNNLTISTYAVCMTLGLMLSATVCSIEARRQHIRLALMLDAILAAVVFGVIAARLGYVLINWAYYQDHIIEAARLWQGGLNWEAGLIGGSIGAWLIARRQVVPMRLLDVLAVGLPLGIALGWLGSYLSATAFGKELYPGQPFFFLATDVPDWFGFTNPRWPTQVIGLVWAFILFTALWFTRKKAWPDGLRYWLLVAAYSLGAFLIGFTRGADMPLVGGWRVDQILDVLLFSVAFIQLARIRRRASPAARPAHDMDATAA
jgi:phosphatidylglycerol---prolipoprotein diacylglyceryl transferase